MSFTTVPTVSNGDSWSAAQHNTYLRDNMAALWPFTTAGDLAYASASNALTRLALGTSYKFLQAGASAPAWGGLHYASVYHNTTQNLTSGVSTALLFNSENVDAQGWHSTSVNTSRLTVGANGYYVAGWSFSYSGTGGSGTYYDDIEIALDGTTFHFERHHAKPVDATGKYYAGSSRLMYAAANSYFEIWVTQRSTSTRPVGSGATFTLWRVD